MINAQLHKSTPERYMAIRWSCPSKRLERRHVDEAKRMDVFT
jgi:hypothetical protein